MTGIGWTEFIVIALILLLFVGPQKLPELASKIAYVVAQLKAASRDLRNQLDAEVAELKQVKSEITDEMMAKAEEVYAEARDLDDEFKALQDDANDIKDELKTDLKEIPSEVDASGTTKKDEARKDLAPKTTSKVSSQTMTTKTTNKNAERKG